MLSEWKHSPRSIWCIPPFAWPCGYWVRHSLWLVVCGGLMPFYETSEEKPKSNCSFLWCLSDSSLRSCSFSQFLFILLRVSTALYLPAQKKIIFSFDEEIILKNKELVCRRLQLKKKAQGSVCAVLPSRRLQPLRRRSQVTTQSSKGSFSWINIVFFFLILVLVLSGWRFVLLLFNPWR